MPAAAHAHQKRMSGEPYITHPLAVAVPSSSGGWTPTPSARPDARCPGRYGDHQARTGRTLRQGSRRAGRWPVQARQDGVRLLPGGAGRKLPQDADGDGARPARRPHQAGRPPAQPADHVGHARRQARPHRPRNAGNLRPIACAWVSTSCTASCRICPFHADPPASRRGAVSRPCARRAATAKELLTRSSTAFATSWRMPASRPRFSGARRASTRFSAR